MPKYLEIVLVIFFSIYSNAGPQDLEAQGVCSECLETQTNKLKQTANEIEKSLKNKKNICDEKGIIDTKRKAALNKLLPITDQTDEKEYIFRQTISCLYGLGEGGVQSVISLVKSIADLSSGAYNTGKNLVQFFAENKAGEYLESIDLKKLSTQLLNTTGKATSAIVDSVQKLSNNLKSAYQDAGLSGAISLIGFEIWQKSPHQLIKNLALKTINGLTDFLSRESDRFNCLDNESKGELLCKMIATVGTDLAIGSGIAKVLVWGKSAVVSKAKQVLSPTSAESVVSVETQLTNATEVAVKELSHAESEKIISTYKLSKKTSNNASKLLENTHVKDRHALIKLLENTQNAEPEMKKKIADLLKSLSDLPQETLKKIDVANILDEASEAAKLGRGKIIEDWKNIVNSDLKNGNLTCFLASSAR